MAETGKHYREVETSSMSELIFAKDRLGTKPSIQVVTPGMSSSKRHRESIAREAEFNAEYYKQREKQDNFRLPWFRYTRKDTQYSEFVMLTTEMAKALLDNMWTEGNGNRKLKPNVKDAYKRDIVAGRWIHSDESIGIDINGVVYNGRHRMTALFESGIPHPFYITFNGLEEAKFTVDSGVKRSSSDKLRLVLPETKMRTKITAFCKATMRGIASGNRYTEMEVAEFANKWADLISWIADHLPFGRAEIQAAIAKAYLWYGPENIEPFCHRFHKLHFHEEGDPARTLYMAISKNKGLNVHGVTYRKTLAAIDAEINGKSLTRLFERDSDIFQWGENWDLPNGSWYAKNSA